MEDIGGGCYANQEQLIGIYCDFITNSIKLTP